MQDPRALANTRNLNSYRAWQRQGFERSGFMLIFTMVPLFVVLLPSALALLPGAARDARAWLLVAGSAFAVYVVIVAALALVAVLRLNAWKRAHPWSPPARHPGSRAAAIRDPAAQISTPPRSGRA